MASECSKDKACHHVHGILMRGSLKFPYLAHIRLFDTDLIEYVDVDLDHDQLSEASDRFVHENEDSVTQAMSRHAITLFNLRMAGQKEEFSNSMGLN